MYYTNVFIFAISFRINVNAYTFFFVSYKYITLIYAAMDCEGHDPHKITRSVSLIVLTFFENLTGIFFFIFGSGSYDLWRVN